MAKNYFQFGGKMYRRTMNGLGFVPKVETDEALVLLQEINNHR